MRTAATLLILMLANGCDKREPPAEAPAGSNAATATSGPSAFQPLQSDQVREAMHRALRSGETQRWQDGALSGYAVPGPPGRNGCRAIRYTVDQRPDVPFESITACEAN